MTVRAAAAVRVAALTVVAGALVTGCAQPGQLGHPTTDAPAPPPAAVAPVASAAPGPDGAPPAVPGGPAGPQVLGEGRVGDALNVRTKGAADLSVRTDVLEPGASTGWKRNPGPELVVVKTGSVALQVEGACADDPYASGAGFAVPDGKPYQVRNTGDQPVELVMTRLFAPGFPDPEDVPPAC